jgi:hypothetical protein
MKLDAVLMKGRSTPIPRPIQFNTHVLPNLPGILIHNQHPIRKSDSLLHIMGDKKNRLSSPLRETE